MALYLFTQFASTHKRPRRWLRLKVVILPASSALIVQIAILVLHRDSRKK